MRTWCRRPPPPPMMNAARAGSCLLAGVCTSNSGAASRTTSRLCSFLRRSVTTTKLSNGFTSRGLSHDTAVAPVPFPSSIHVDLDAIAGNVAALRHTIGDKVKLGVAVKADAYGHGAHEVARTAMANGADLLCVAAIAEAAELRLCGFTDDMLCMGYVPPPQAAFAAQHGVVLTVADVETATAYEREAAAVNARLQVHVKVDSGMGRFGVMPDDAASLVSAVQHCEHLELTGMYTHFSVADELAKIDYTRKQKATFDKVVASLVDTGHLDRERTMVHCANSAATVRSSEFHEDMVRCGLAMYGCHPGSGVDALPTGPVVPGGPEFRQAISWRTSIVQVKELPAGYHIGYGNTYTSPSPILVGLLPVGYGNGFRRGPLNPGHVLVRGRLCPLLGRVSMEKTVVLLSDAPDLSMPGGSLEPRVGLGEEVVIMGTHSPDAVSAYTAALQHKGSGGGDVEAAGSAMAEASISVEEAAEALGTNNYEALCGALARTSRSTHGHYFHSSS